MEIFFQVVAAILAATTAFFWWTGESDKAFAAFVLASAAFFLGYRFRLKKRIAARARKSTLNE
ncbi:MAG: hypothetical protein JO053_09635 [Acidobacteria bacterium]|nr:hypothetical protein [Acidobacteriota bacterium]